MYHFAIGGSCIAHQFPTPLTAIIVGSSAAFTASSFPVALTPEEIAGAELRHEQLICCKSSAQFGLNARSNCSNGS